MTNAYHESIKHDLLCLALVPVLDGTRDDAALNEALLAHQHTERLPLTLPDGTPPDSVEMTLLVHSKVAGNLRC